VEGVLKTDHGGPFGVAARNLDSILDCFSAAVHKEGFLRERSGGQLVQLFSQFNETLVGDYLKAGMQKMVGLTLNSFNHEGCAVTRVDDSDTAREIYEDISVHVFEQRPLRF
jgi:hypothetical protein